ncbi:hypothetical protein WDU94_010663 [Cyamophila willieti]
MSQMTIFITSRRRKRRWRMPFESLSMLGVSNEYEPSHSDPDSNVSILTDEEENAVLSCKRFMRLLNAKIAKAEEDRQTAKEERQRVDELSFRERQQERQRVDELSFRERQLEADTALKEQEMASKERIELERIRSTAATTQVETSHSSGLPKIDLTKFSGDVTNFTEFIDSFNALVHNRSGLKANEMFHYLKSVVQGLVAKLIEGIRVTDANYPIALDLLKETYGSKPVIVTKLFDELNELKPVSWKPNDLYSFYQNVEDCRNDTSLSAITPQNDPSSSSSSDNYRVFLQSATVLVRNKSKNRDIEAHVVFDSGATASYITESLRLSSVRPTSISIAPSNETNVRSDPTRYWRPMPEN